MTIRPPKAKRRTVWASLDPEEALRRRLQKEARRLKKRREWRISRSNPVIETVQTPAQVGGFYKVQGVHFVNPAGNPFKPRGYNLGGWNFIEKFLMEPDSSDLSGPGVVDNERTMTSWLNTFYTGRSVPYGSSTGTQFFKAWRDNFITQTDITMIAAEGANIVRVGISDFVISDGRVLPYLDNLVAWCKSANLCVVLDMGTMPGCFNSSTNCSADGVPRLWGSATNKTAAIATWVTLANRYKDEPAIFGYDLIGEPNGVSDAELQTFYQTLIPAIRAVDPNHILMIEPGSNALNTSVLRNGWLLTTDANSAYSPHLYAAEGCNEPPPNNNYNGYVARIQDYAIQQIQPLLSHGRPFYIGEFGGNCGPWVNAATDSLLAAESSSGTTFGATYFTWKGLRPNSDESNAMKPIMNINNTGSNPRAIWKVLMDTLTRATSGIGNPDYTQVQWDNAFAAIRTDGGNFHFRAVPQGHLQDYFEAP